MGIHPFDAATAVAAVGPDRWRTRLDPDWFGTAAPHGGHLAAQLLAAIVAHAGDAELSPRSLTVHFTSPGAPGELEIATRLERAGRNLSTLSASATQGGRAVALALAAVGRDREGPELRDAAFPRVPAARELAEPSEWTRETDAAVRQHYELRSAIGRPHSGEAAHAGGWVRPNRPRPADHLLTTALSDLWYPAVLVTLPERVPTTTVELTVNFLAAVDGLRDDGWYLTRFAIPAAADGYFREEGEVWGEDGRLLARSSQLAVFLSR
jgi:acyl-CoA thioesterase